MVSKAFPLIFAVGGILWHVASPNVLRTAIVEIGSLLWASAVGSYGSRVQTLVRWILGEILEPYLRYIEKRLPGPTRHYKARLRDYFSMDQKQNLGRLHHNIRQHVQIYVALVVQKRTSTERESNQIWHYLHSLVTTSGSKIMTIRGHAGSGKTTLMRDIVLNLSSVRKPYKWAPDFVFHFAAREIPTSYWNEPTWNKDTLSRIIYDLHGDSPNDVTADWVSSRLEKDNCLVIVDGVDEVSLESRREVLGTWLNKLHVLKDVHFIVTARPQGFPKSLHPHIELELKDFTPKQVDEFVRRWYNCYGSLNWFDKTAEKILRLHPDTQSRLFKSYSAWISRQRQAKALLAHLQSQIEGHRQIRRLTSNPFHLLMLVELFSQRREGANANDPTVNLPTSVVDLYNNIIDVHFERRANSENVSDNAATSAETLSNQHFRAVAIKTLCALAYYLQKSGGDESAEYFSLELASNGIVSIDPSINDQLPNGTSIQDFLNEIGRRTSLLQIPRTGANLSFPHRSVREYLAALYLLNNSAVVPTSPAQWMHLITMLDWWHETILFYAGHIDSEARKNANITPVLNTIVCACETSGSAGMELASRLFFELRSVDESHRNKLAVLLDGALGKNVSQREFIRASGRMLEDYLSKVENCGDDSETIEGSRLVCRPVPRWLYRWYISDAGMQILGQNGRLPPHLRYTDDLVAEPRLPVTGMLFDDAVAFCEWLTARDWMNVSYRLPRFQAEEELARNHLAGNLGCWASDRSLLYKKGSTWVEPLAIEQADLRLARYPLGELPPNCDKEMQNLFTKAMRIVRIKQTALIFLVGALTATTLLLLGLKVPFAYLLQMSSTFVSRLWSSISSILHNNRLHIGSLDTAGLDPRPVFKAIGEIWGSIDDPVIQLVVGFEILIGFACLLTLLSFVWRQVMYIFVGTAVISYCGLVSAFILLRKLFLSGMQLFIRFGHFVAKSTASIAKLFKMRPYSNKDMLISFGRSLFEAIDIDRFVGWSLNRDAWNKWTLDKEVEMRGKSLSFLLLAIYIQKDAAIDLASMCGYDVDASARLRSENIWDLLSNGLVRKHSDTRAICLAQRLLLSEKVDPLRIHDEVFSELEKDSSSKELIEHWLRVHTTRFDEPSRRAFAVAVLETYEMCCVKWLNWASIGNDQLANLRQKLERLRALLSTIDKRSACSSSSAPECIFVLSERFSPRQF